MPTDPNLTRHQLQAVRDANTPPNRTFDLGLRQRFPYRLNRSHLDFDFALIQGRLYATTRTTPREPVSAAAAHLPPAVEYPNTYLNFWGRRRDPQHWEFFLNFLSLFHYFDHALVLSDARDNGKPINLTGIPAHLAIVSRPGARGTTLDFVTSRTNPLDPAIQNI